MTGIAPDMSARFALMIAGLCRVVAAHIAADRTAGAWITLVWSRLSRIGQRVQRLAAQARAGSIPKLGTRFTLTKPRKPATRPPIVLAGKPGWLIHRIQAAAVYAEYLRQILDDPEMAALLAAAPQLARILRPLCRALGVVPPPHPKRPALPDPTRPAPALPDPTRPDPALPDPAPPDPAAPISASPQTRPEPARSPHPARARSMPVRPVSVNAGHRLKPA